MKYLFFFELKPTRLTAEVFAKDFDEASIKVRDILKLQERTRIEDLILRNVTENFDCPKCHPPQMECNAQ